MSEDVDRGAIEANLATVRERIRVAATKAGRSPGSVRLVAVTKTVGPVEVKALHDSGIRDFGENRLEHAQAIISESPVPATWHMIGPVQRRKARDVAKAFACVDSIDRVEAAEALNKWAKELDKTLAVLVEVNVSGEPSKHGFGPHELPAALDAMQVFESLRVDGLMTMAPWVEDPEDTRPLFARLRELAAAHGLRELSMGMSNDYEVAVEEGATQVRIGTALFV